MIRLVIDAASAELKTYNDTFDSQPYVQVKAYYGGPLPPVSPLYIKALNLALAKFQTSFVTGPDSGYAEIADRTFIFPDHVVLNPVLKEDTGSKILSFLRELEREADARYLDVLTWEDEEAQRQEAIRTAQQEMFSTFRKQLLGAN